MESQLWGLSVSELARIKELEAENARLKRMYVDLSLPHHGLKDAVEKCCKPLGQTGDGYLMQQEYKASLRQGCKAVGLPYSYQRKPKDDQMIIDKLLELTGKHPAIGFWQCYYRLRSMGYRWNQKCVYRVYCSFKAVYSTPNEETSACTSQAAVVPVGGILKFIQDYNENSLCF